MARTQVVTDAFPYADGFPSSNWGDLDGSSGQVQVIANAVRNGFSGSMSDMRWTGAGSIGNDQYAQITITGLSGTGESMGVIARAASTANPLRNGYRCYLFDSGTKTLRIAKVVNDTETVLASDTTLSGSWANGDTVSIECEGTTIRAFRNATQALSITDATFSSGSVGVCAVRGGNETIRGDNFDAGNVTSGDTTAPSLTAGPSVINITSSGFDVQGTTDEDCTAYLVVTAAGASQPSDSTFDASTETATATNAVQFTINHTG